MNTAMAQEDDDIPAPAAPPPDSERRLRETERRFRAFVMATSDVVYCMSPDWREMRYLVGKDFIADTHRPSRAWLQRYIHPDDQMRVLRAIGNAIRNKSQFELEHRIIRADGTLGWTFSRAIPLLDDAGAIVEWFGTAKDVSQRKRAEEELREADRRKDEFIAVLAHELRNPLAPLTNAMHLLRRAEAGDSIQVQARTIIERQIAVMTRLVDDLMEMARITTGRLQLHTERIALAVVVERAVESVSALIEQRRHHLDVSVAAEAIDVCVDPARLQQVLVNLLNNAAKYTDEGGRIDVTVSREDECAVVRVRDSGIGIEPDVLPKLFQPFMQAPRSLSRSQGGLGIGLSIVRRLVEMHGGTVEAQSRLGEGSEFAVKLPALGRLAASSAAATSQEPGRRSGQPLRVLVIDDDVDTAHSLAMLLETTGHSVHVAHDGVSALQLATRVRPHVAFVDIGLPQVDGYEFARQLRADPALREVELIAVTGYGRADDSLRSRDAGYSEHLVKPVDFAIVEEILLRAAARLGE